MLISKAKDIFETWLNIKCTPILQEYSYFGIVNVSEKKEKEKEICSEGKGCVYISSLAILILPTEDSAAE